MTLNGDMNGPGDTNDPGDLSPPPMAMIRMHPRAIDHSGGEI